MSTLTETDRRQLTGDYTIDTGHSRIGFVARHAMVTKVRGTFEQFHGRAHLDGDDPTRSSAQLTMQAKSINTRNNDRDAHLRSNDFLAPDEFPELTFTSTRVEDIGDDRYRMTGDLTIRGVTKPVTIGLEYGGAARDPFGNFRVGFEGSVVINRRDWGVNWNAPIETGGFLVSEKVTLELDISAIRDEPVHDEPIQE